MKFICSLLLFLFLTGMVAQAQFIQSITVIPANPTVTDSIMVIADCGFPAGSCDESTQTLFQFGNAIYGSALHCIGMLTIICYDTDTFILGPQAAGNYTFHFQLNAGALPSPCTPGIVPGPDDSITFFVSPAVGVNEYIGQDAVQILPNPAVEKFSIAGFDAVDYPVSLVIYSINGNIALKATLRSREEQVEISSLTPGAYQVSGATNSGKKFAIPFVKSLSE